MILGSQSRHLMAEKGQHNFASEIPDVVENFDPDEMVVTVGGATAIARLMKLSCEHGLVPSGIQPDEVGTFGGLFSDPREGPCDSFSGRFRDHVLGIEGYRGDGGSLLSGGRVVKNVTGYDLVRLLGGALGALGVVTRLHLRLERQAACWHRIDWPMTNEIVSWETLDSIRRLPFEPYWLSMQPAEQRCQILLAGTMRSIEESLQLLEPVIGSTDSCIDSREIGYQELVQSHREKRAAVGNGLRVRMPWQSWRHVTFSAPGKWRSIF
ncbi:MAG: hypothetical protein AAEJ04_01940, partial [Planctomycetota bacterium]